MKNYFIILLLISLVYVSVSADEKQNELENYDFKIIATSTEGKEIQETTVIEFVNMSNAKVIKSVNVPEDSPYYNLPFKKKIQGDRRYPYYYYSDLKVEDFFKDSTIIDSDFYAKYKNKTIMQTKLASRIILCRNYIGVINHLIAFKGDDSYGIKSTLIVYNRKGNIVLHLPDIFPGIDEIGMSGDSNYLAFSFGNDGIIDLVDYVGISVYDLSNGKEIFRREFPRRNVTINSLAVVGDLFLYSISQWDNLGNRISTYNYIVPEKRTIYTAELPTSITNQIKKYSEDGLILHRKGGELYSFEDNFEKEKF